VTTSARPTATIDRGCGSEARLSVQYVTRARIHVDRIATAWAIRRFVDPQATFVFVDRNRDVAGLDAIPFDVRGAELGHRGGRCTFETLLSVYELTEPGLRRMAAVIRGADLPHEDASPLESPGVAAIFDGLRDSDLSDEDRLERGFAICDSLFSYCASPAP
jgi:hypothetical protein